MTPRTQNEKDRDQRIENLLISISNSLKEINSKISSEENKNAK